MLVGARPLFVAFARLATCRVTSVSRRSRLGGDDPSVGDGELRLRLLEVGGVHDLDDAASPGPFPDAEPDAEACARTCPPTAGSIPAKAIPLGSAWTWFVYTTATLNSSAILLSLERNCPSLCCRSAELAAADEVHPEVRHDGVDDEELNGPSRASPRAQPERWTSSRA